MDGYKGYGLHPKGTGKKVLVSPLGEDIAVLQSVFGRRIPLVLVLTEGIEARASYSSVTEIVRDLADKHRQFVGGDLEHSTPTPSGGPTVINRGTVQNLQVNQDSQGVQVSGDQKQKAGPAAPKPKKSSIMKWARTLAGALFKSP